MRFGHQIHVARRYLEIQTLHSIMHAVYSELTFVPFYLDLAKNIDNLVL